MDPATSTEYDRQLRERCEQDGVSATRQLLARGRYNERKAPIVRAWLAEQDALAASADRDEELAIARDANSHAATANRIARSARNWSIAAVAVSTFALAVASYAAIRQFPLSLATNRVR